MSELFGIVRSLAAEQYKYQLSGTISLACTLLQSHHLQQWIFFKKARAYNITLETLGVKPLQRSLTTPVSTRVHHTSGNGRLWIMILRQ